MDSWKIPALIGTFLLAFSASLPLVSVIIPLNLIDFYGLQTGVEQNPRGGTWKMPDALTGLFVIMWLHPIALMFGVLSILRRRFAVVAGSAGIACWLLALFTVSAYKSTYTPQELSPLIQIGSGIPLGIAASIVILIPLFLKPKSINAPPAERSGSG